MKCLILSDIHGNWPALQAVLAAEPDVGQILCLGDLVNYGPQPTECVAWAMKLNPPSRIIQGNHDRAFAQGVEPHCAPANRLFALAMSMATDSLPAIKMKEFLAGLAPLQSFSWGKTSCFACHRVSGHPLDSDAVQRLNEDTWNATELTRMHSDIILTGVPDKLFVLVGHPDFLFMADSHRAVQTKLYGTVVVNPGSVGMPADGDPRAAYAVWQDGEVMLRRVAYDVEETVRAFDSLDLDEHIKQQLVEGLRNGTCLTTRPVAEPAIAG
jgi:predicted phosphodiesterase